MRPSAKHPAEGELAGAVPSGRALDLTGRPAAARVVRGEFVAALARDPHHLGTAGARISLRGARVTGVLDLEFADVRCDLALTGCTFDSPMVLEQAKLLYLDLTGSALPGLRGYQSEIGYDLVLDGVTASGEVRLIGATVRAGLSCVGATLSAGLLLDAARISGDLVCRGMTTTGAPALSAVGLVVDGTVLLDALLVEAGVTPFTAIGTVSFVRASIGGDLVCDGAQLAADTAAALTLERASITGDCWLRPLNEEGPAYTRFRATGPVTLLGTAVGGMLDCSGSRFDAGSDEPTALTLEAATVRVAWLSSQVRRDGVVQPMEVLGALVLRGTRVKEDLTMDGAQLTGLRPDPIALDGDGLVVGGMVNLEEFRHDDSSSRFSADGTVSFAGAEISGALMCRGARFRSRPGPDGPDPRDRPALSLNLARVVKGINLVDSKCDGWQDLSYASTELFEDDAGAWPLPGDLDVTGFRYVRLTNSGTLDDRLGWLRRQADFSPLPYEQLMTEFRAQGRPDWASRVGVEKERRSYREQGVRLRSLLLRLLIGYGYRPARALAWLVLLIALTTAVFWRAGEQNAMVSTQQALVRAEQCTASYPCFSPLAYSVDIVVPLLNLRQAEYWQPDAAHGQGRRLYSWTAAVLGWVLSTLGIAGLSGVLQRPSS